MSLIRCWSYGVLPAIPSASRSLAIASAYFFALRSSWASLRGFASLALLVCLPSAAKAGVADARAAATMRGAHATGTRVHRVASHGVLVSEFSHVDEADLLHVVALRRRQHLRDDLVSGATVGTQVN